MELEELSDESSFMGCSNSSSRRNEVWKASKNILYVADNKWTVITFKLTQVPSQVKKVKVFVASPGDVQRERDQLAKVINELNLIISAIAPEKAIVLELIRWETHVYPGLGKDSQVVVNEQIGEYDIFIGIIWKRLGTPTVIARSGTEEEFQRAYSVWQKNKSLPVLFYFCQQQFPPPRSREEVEQLGKVVDFRDELTKKGLVADYADHDSFADIIRPHLLLVLGQMFTNTPGSSGEVSQVVFRTDKTQVYQEVIALAQQYEDIRATVESGDPRTRKMEIIVSKMKSLAFASLPWLQDLARSGSPGQRLVAITILQSIPNPEYLSWLAERLIIEKPFIGYHAAFALLNAVRALGRSHYIEVKEAVEGASRGMVEKYGDLTSESDRFKVLIEAQSELASVLNDAASKK